MADIINEFDERLLTLRLKKGFEARKGLWLDKQRIEP